MIYRVLSFVIFVIIVTYLLVSRQTQEEILIPQVSPPPTTPVVTTTPEPKKLVTYGEGTYQYDKIGPIMPERITLSSNLPDKQSSITLKEENACTYLTSGGFYSKEDTHIGLFEKDAIVIQKQSKNALFNGLIWKTEKNVSGIGTILPDEPLSFALQSGPILLENGTPRTLKIINDEQARRILVAVDMNNQVYFFVLTGEENTFSGPLLAEVPEILLAIAIKEKINLLNALNLDGGNHSTFHGVDATYSELSRIGSFFCIKDNP